MIRSIVKFGVLLVVGLVFFNYFLGTPDEKAKAKNTISKAKEAGKVIGGVLLEGKYDNAIKEVGELISNIKNQVEGVDGEMLDRINDLEKQKESIEGELEQSQGSGGEISKEKIEKLKKQFENLTEKTGQVLKDLKNGN